MCICIPVYISRFTWILLLTTQVLRRVDGGRGKGRQRVALISFVIFFFPSQKDFRYIFSNCPLPPSVSEHWLPVWFNTYYVSWISEDLPFFPFQGYLNFYWWEKLSFKPVNRVVFFHRKFTFCVFHAFNVPKIVFHRWVQHCQPLCTTLQAFAQLCKFDLWN